MESRRTQGHIQEASKLPYNQVSSSIVGSLSSSLSYHHHQQQFKLRLSISTTSFISPRFQVKFIKFFLKLLASASTSSAGQSVINTLFKQTPIHPFLYARGDQITPNVHVRLTTYATHIPSFSSLLDILMCASQPMQSPGRISIKPSTSDPLSPISFYLKIFYVVLCK